MKFAIALALFICTVTAGHAHECPDKKASCPSYATCCMMMNKAYGCCPIKDAICCSHDLCCPQGTTCDTKAQVCIGKNLAIPFPWMVQVYDHEVTLKGVTETETQKEEMKVEEEQSPMDVSYASNLIETGLAAPFNVFEPEVVCPDKTQSCPSFATCCPYAKGGYACCPFSGATCCPDKLKCCPNGYVCSGKYCVRKPTLPFFYQTNTIEKAPLQVAADMVN